MLKKIAEIAVVTVLPLGAGIVSSISSPVVANAAKKQLRKLLAKLIFYKEVKN